MPGQTLPFIALTLVLVTVGAQHADGQSPSLPSTDTLILHRFDQSTHGWSLTTDTGTAQAEFAPTGGDPGGCIMGSDEATGETWYFRAPTAVVEQLALAEGGIISFSLRQSTDVEGGFLDDDVVIVGKAGRLGYRFGRGSAPGTAWKRFSVRLSASAGWKWNAREPATQAQIRSVLATALALEIRGEYATGPDEGFLDNFALRRRE